MVQDNHSRAEKVDPDDRRAKNVNSNDSRAEERDHDHSRTEEREHDHSSAEERDSDDDEVEAEASTESPLDRDISTERNRAFDQDPPVDSEDLHDFESDLQSVTFPATGREIVAAVGEQRFLTKNESYTIAELIPETDVETYDSPGSVRVVIQRPTVAAAMKRIVDASSSLPGQKFPYSQRRAYEKTFQELRAMDANDEDEDVAMLSDWVVQQIHDRNRLPGSRAVRQQAADMCRNNGYRLRNDEWLGV